MKSRSTYHSYLLRLWSTEEDGQIRWRASLERPHQAGRIGFRSLKQLFAFLEDQTEDQISQAMPHEVPPDQNS